MDSPRVSTKNIVLTAVALLVVTSGFYVYQAFSVVLRSEALYSEAQADLESGADDAAESALVEAVRINPSHEDAKDLLLRLRQGTGVSSEPQSGVAGGDADASDNPGVEGRGGASPTRADDVADAAGASQAGGAHNRLQGYELVGQESGPGWSKSVFKASETDSPGAFVELRIEKFKEPSGASDALYNRRFAYPKVQQKIMLNSRMAYHGTDGKNTAILAWARDDELVELKTICSGDSTAGSLNALLEAAKELF